MKKYNVIDLSERNAKEELKEYTIEQLKEMFLVEDDEISNREEIVAVKDIEDLKELLEKEAAGMAVHYEFKEVE